MPSATPDPSGFVSAPPDPSGLPGADQIMVIIGGIRWAALVACLAALVVGAAVWAFSSHQGNPYYASKAKVGVIGAVVGAALIGAAPAIIQWLYSLGTQVGG
jgi:hypothetical protein